MRIFISSTFEDLKEYREAALRAVQRLAATRPLSGRRQIRLAGDLAAVTMMDGTSTVAHVIEDAQQRPQPNPITWPGAASTV